VKTSIGVILATTLTATAVALVYSTSFDERFEANRACCQIPIARNAVVTARELLGKATYYSEIGQDKWVLETMFPGVRDGYFVDVGSGHGTIGSNTKALEEAGWTGICIDPFPVHMEGRTCRLFEEVVFSEAGRRMGFRAAGGLAGLDATLGRWNEKASKAPLVEFTTVTLADILARAGAPSFIHFISLDIEGAELEALRAFPFDRIRVGAFAIEHNEEEPKRSRLITFLERYGYRRVHSYRQDDYFAPVSLR
jgi:Methyltransferase FkbM domain